MLRGWNRFAKVFLPEDVYKAMRTVVTGGSLMRR